LLPAKLWMNAVFTVPNRRSQTEPKRAFAGGRVFLRHSYRANSVSNRTLSNSRPPSRTRIGASRPFRRTHFAEDHHARAIARRIERQIKCGHAPRESVCQQCQPRPAKQPVGTRAPKFYIELGVIMWAISKDDPRAVESLAPAPSRRAPPCRRTVLPGVFAFGRLPGTCVDRAAKRLVTRVIGRPCCSIADPSAHHTEWPRTLLQGSHSAYR